MTPHEDARLIKQTKKNWFLFECIQCSERFEIIRSAVNNGRGRYCSKSCYMTHRQRDGGGLNRKSGTMSHRGYVLEWAPDHPAAVKDYVPQHRLVVERELGRLLTKSEVVHHINHIKDDNRPENLEVMTHAQHMREHKACWIEWGDEKLSFTQAVKRLGKCRSNVRRNMKKLGFNHQQAVDYYRGITYA